MLKTIPTDRATGKEYMSIYTDLYDKNIPVQINIAQYAGVFDSVLITGAATYNILEAKGTGGIVLTDLVLSLDKRNLGEADIYFTDGTNTESILLVSTNDAPANFSVPFNGRWQCWQGASLKADVVAAVVGCISVGYFRTSEYNTYAYDAWVARR